MPTRPGGGATPGIVIDVGDDEKKQETYLGEGGRRYGSANAAANSFISAAERRARASKAAFSAYKNEMASWGVKITSVKQAKAIASFLAGQASRAGANEAPRTLEFKDAFIKKFWNVWVKSGEGSARVLKAKTALESAFGADWKKQVKGNKELVKILKAYAGRARPMEDAQLDALIEGSKTFKKATAEGGELQYLKKFQAANIGAGQKSLAEQVADYGVYRKAFTDTMKNYGASAEQIVAEEALFFGSGVTGEGFDARFKEYNTNRQAYYELIGEGLTEQDRQAVLYGTNIAAQGMRDKIARATDVNALFQSTRGAFQSVAGRELSRAEKTELLAGQGERTKQALGRAGDVSQTLGQTAESYRLQTGAQLTQAQKDKLLYDEQAGDVYGALRSAFSLQKSYRSGGAGTFGFARSSSGALTQNV